MVDGRTQRRTALVANTEEIIKFIPAIQSISLCITSGNVAYRLNSTISSVNDNAANILAYSLNPAVDILKDRAVISEIHLMSDSATTIQWDSTEI